jgi:para-aminobenzoate synthetase component 2
VLQHPKNQIVNVITVPRLYLVAVYEIVRPDTGVSGVSAIRLERDIFSSSFGGTVSRAPELLHGKTSVVTHSNTGVLRDLPSPFTATRYHSLAIEDGTLPEEIEVIARTDSGVIMAVQHKSLPISGVQFHPESVLTEHGHQMLGNWLVACGDSGARERSNGLSPVVAR